MLQLAFKVAADKPSTRKITLVQQVGYPDNVIDFGGPIVAGGENLQMGEGDTLKLELYEDGQPVAVLDQLQAIVSIPTAISFANRANTSCRPDGGWWGKQVLLTATIGGEEVRHWVRFYDHHPTPVVTEYVADLMPGEPIYMNGGTLQAIGTNLAGATKVRFRYAEDGEPFYEADVVESTDASAECGPLGYTGTLEARRGYFSVITPGGESNKVECGFNP